MRATSKRLCFMASMARSNRTLSGCLEPTFASGLLTFLLVQAAVRASSAPSRATHETRRRIETSGEIFAGFDPDRQTKGVYRFRELVRLFARSLLWRPSKASGR